MKAFLVLLSINLLVFCTLGGNIFCFPVCGGCSNISYDGCSSCQAGNGFTKSGSTCVKTAYTYYSTGQKWQPVGTTPDVSTSYAMGQSTNITLQPIGVSPSVAGSCANATTTYNYYQLFGGQTLFVSHPGVVGNVFYYQVRIIYGVIAIDQMASTVTTTFTSNASSITSFTDPLTGGGTNQSKNCVDASKFQLYQNVDRVWSYTDPTSLDFSITTDSTDPAKTWGVMNIIITVRLCHPYCTVCSGDGWQNVCTACNYYDQMAKLSATTCNLTCAPGYGDQTLDPAVCIVCDTNCKYCVDLPQTCHNCYSPMLLLQVTTTNITCVTACPTHYYPNTTGNDTCMICDPICQNCTSLPTRCTSCYSGTYLYQNTCWNPCPAQTYNDDVTRSCRPCDKYCSVCAFSATNCSVCDTVAPWIAYLKDNITCTTDCGPGFFKDDNSGAGPNLCVGCDIKCLTCDINSTYCFSCNATYFLLDNTCGVDCPFPAYFPDNVTRKCLSCAVACVNMTMDVYWKDSLHEDLICDLTFTQDLSWGPAQIRRFLSVSVDDPLISIDNFNLVYEAVSPRTMRLTLSPKGYTFIYNVTFKFKTIDLVNNQYDYAANMYRFSDNNYGVTGSMNWFLIKAPSLSNTEKKIMDGVSGFSSTILKITTLPYMQQVKKAGIFALLLGGAQVTSTACLVNSIPSQNFYEGVRLWASFVFFDVPPWEQDSKKSKFVVVPNVNDLIRDARLLQNQRRYMSISNRTLFDTSTIGWRFQRTGHTSFFIYDTYINIVLIVICWILMAIAHYCIKHKIYKRKFVSAFYSFTIKVHEVSIFYISLATMLEWIFFDAASIQRWISLGLCLLFNFYFLLYELYIYYDMINYPAAIIGNQKYDYYCLRYGSLLKNIRFIQYDPREQWSVKHWFRPYNYHILSYYKKFLMMICLPIFYTTRNAQIGVLMVIQLFEIIRFVVVWPFKSKVRNFIRLGLEFCLMFFFMSVIIQTFEITEIMMNNPDTLQKSVDIFYKIGWFGFAMCWTFNIGHLIMFIYDGVMGCRKTNRQMMDEARKMYYMQKLKAYEQQNQQAPIALVNKWVKLGNLNDRKLDQLPDLNLRIQYFSVKRVSGGFQIDMKKLFEVFMNIEFNYQKQNNLSSGKKINKRITLTRPLSPIFYGTIESLYNQYMGSVDFQYMIIKTFQKISQSDHKPGEKIKLDVNIMTQRIELETYAGQKKIIKLQKMLHGFPISFEDLKHLM